MPVTPRTAIQRYEKWGVSQVSRAICAYYHIIYTKENYHARAISYDLPVLPVTFVFSLSPSGVFTVTGKLFELVTACDSSVRTSYMIHCSTLKTAEKQKTALLDRQQSVGPVHDAAVLLEMVDGVAGGGFGHIASTPPD